MVLWYGLVSPIHPMHVISLSSIICVLPASHPSINLFLAFSRNKLRPLIHCSLSAYCISQMLVHKVNLLSIASNSTCYLHQPAHLSVVGNIPIATKPRALSVSWRSAYATALRPSVRPSACLSTCLSICTTNFNLI